MVDMRSTTVRVEGLEHTVATTTKDISDIRTTISVFSEKFDRHSADMATFTTVLNDLVKKFETQTIAKPANEPQLFPYDPLPGPQPTASLPTFDRTEPLAWLARAAQFFLVHQTPVAQRVPLALIALSDPALPWVQLLIRRDPALSWDTFSKALLARFGEDTAIDNYEALHRTRQEGSLSEYIALFEARLAQTPDVPDHQHEGIFLGGLKPSIRMQIKDTSITSYDDAVQMAIRIDRMKQARRETNGQHTSILLISPLPTRCSNHHQSPRICHPVRVPIKFQPTFPTPFPNYVQ